MLGCLARYRTTPFPYMWLSKKEVRGLFTFFVAGFLSWIDYVLCSALTYFAYGIGCAMWDLSAIYVWLANPTTPLNGNTRMQTPGCTDLHDCHSPCIMFHTHVCTVSDFSGLAVMFLWLFLILQIIWYREGDLDPKFRRFIYFNAFTTILLCIAGNLFFHLPMKTPACTCPTCPTVPPTVPSLLH